MVDHDRLFKELLTTFFIEFLDLFLPEFADHIDQTSLAFIDKEVFTDVTFGDKHEADLVVRAKFKAIDSFFLIHVETQAQQQAQFPRRLFVYFARLHEKYNLPVYPIVLFSFDAPRKLQPQHYVVTFPGREVLSFNYAVIQLNRLNWQEYVRRPNPAAAALMAKMAIAPRDRPYVKLECMRLLTTLKLDPAKQHLISGFIDTYLNLTAQELAIYKRERTLLNLPEQEEIMEIETSWKREGRLEGRQEGRLEGRQEGRLEGQQEGMASLVTKLICRRIGETAESYLEEVQRLKPEQLEALAEALLDFATAADLERWLRSQRTK